MPGPIIVRGAQLYSYEPFLFFTPSEKMGGFARTNHHPPTNDEVMDACVDGNASSKISFFGYISIIALSFLGKMQDSSANVGGGVQLFFFERS